MSQLHTNRTRLIVLTCALLAVAATLVMAISLVSAHALRASACNALHQGEVRLGNVRPPHPSGSTPAVAEPHLWPAGYRLP